MLPFRSAVTLLLFATSAAAQTYEFTTFAGATESVTPRDGTGTAARFRVPIGVVVAPDGNLIVADTGCVRQITPGAVVTTIAGSLTAAGVANGPAATARFMSPWGMAYDTSANLYIVDTFGNTVRRLSTTGEVTTIAGLGAATGSADGNGTTARFNFPVGIAIDRAGNLFVADSFNNTIRRVTPAGDTTTIAGTAGTVGSTDGPGANALFNHPSGLAIDAADHLYVADLDNHTIRKITPAGVVSTFAGTARRTGGTDGLGAEARFLAPASVALDAAGNVFVCEYANHTLRKITPEGAVTTIGGLAGQTGATNGAGPVARFNRPYSIAVDSAGALYIADAGNLLIRKGVIAARPVIQSTAQALSVATGSTVALSVAASGSTLTYQWQKNGAPILGATGSSYVFTAQTLAAGSYSVDVTSPGGTVRSGASAIALAAPAAAAGRIGNLAIRSQAGTGGQTLIVGFAVGGAGTSGSKPILIRGVGPALGAFGLTDFLADPKLEVYASATGAKLNENDNWSGDAQVAAASAAVGAFSLGAPTSRDAALYLPNLASATYTVQISGPATGVALAEIYDATAAAAFTASTPRLVNVSARTQAGLGGDLLIAGFYVGGQTAKTLLIRAIGPTLTAFGVTGAVADPKLELFTGSTKINENDNWGGDPTLAAAFSNVGAFPLANTSRDAALLVTLAPGSYTAQVTGLPAGAGVAGTTGTALVEVYDVP